MNNSIMFWLYSYLYSKINNRVICFSWTISKSGGSWFLHRILRLLSNAAAPCGLRPPPLSVRGIDNIHEGGRVRGGVGESYDIPRAGLITVLGQIELRPSVLTHGAIVYFSDRRRKRWNSTKTWRTGAQSVSVSYTPIMIVIIIFIPVFSSKRVVCVIITPGKIHQM